jgi:SAM-dependent methyltransferase
MAMVDIQAGRGAAQAAAAQDSGETALTRVLREFKGVSPSPRWHSQWVWDNYEELVKGLAAGLRLQDVCEIGGGRDPSFTRAEADAAGIRLIVNDIDAGELALTPAGLDTAHFDVTGDLGGRSNLYDMMISRMVFEHIENVPAAWANIQQLLRPGGVGLAFFPTLYAWPFVINHVIPESLSSRILQVMFPNRRADGNDPKFPARYEWCFGSEQRLRRMLEPMGFSEIVVVPFWGHGYLKSVPVAREIDAAFNKLAAKMDWRLVTTYALVLVRK